MNQCMIWKCSHIKLLTDPSQQNFNFSRPISKKFWFFQAISQKNLIFPGKFLKNFDFSWQIFKKFRYFQADFRKISIFSGNFKFFSDFPGKNCSFTATSGQIILYLFKSHHFLIYFQYMIRYNNIWRPVHDHHDPLLPLCDPLPRPSCAKSGWFATPNPPGLTLLRDPSEGNEGKGIQVLYSGHLASTLCGWDPSPALVHCNGRHARC